MRVRAGVSVHTSGDGTDPSVPECFTDGAGRRLQKRRRVFVAVPSHSSSDVSAACEALIALH